MTPILSATSMSRPGAGPRAWSILSALTAVTLVCILGACAIGSVALSPSDLLAGLDDLLHGTPAGLPATLLQLRLARALTAFVTGGSLALAGVMMQALLRNPLADPYVLGLSGGAAVGALAAMLFFSAAWVIDISAFGGAIAVALLLLLLAYHDLRDGATQGNAPLLLLTGVIVASGCAALVTMMLSIAPDSRLRGMVFWLIGDLSGAQLRLLPFLVLIAAIGFALRVARAINVLALHGEIAATLGIRAGPLRQGLFLCAAMLTASAVGTAGSIGFVGLIVPHACRFALGSDHRLLLPSATLVGGAFLVMADTVARCVLAPQQLPVGVITAMIGVPIFLIQLHHIRRR